MNQAHDQSYKLLFSEPEIVIDLLQGFVHEEWVKELDFSTLEKVSGSYISDDLRAREDDIIWRVKYRQSWIYPAPQRKTSPFMARMQRCNIFFKKTLLFTQLINNDVFDDGLGSGRGAGFMSICYWNFSPQSIATWRSG